VDVHAGVAAPAARTPCKFGHECYRKNELHRARYAHPGDRDWKDEAEETFPCGPHMRNIRELYSAWSASFVEAEKGAERQQAMGCGRHSPRCEAPVRWTLHEDEDIAAAVEASRASAEEEAEARRQQREEEEFAAALAASRASAAEERMGIEDNAGMSLGGLATARPPCKFGHECYCKNEGHWARHSHPGDRDWEDEAPTLLTGSDLAWSSTALPAKAVSNAAVPSPAPKRAVERFEAKLEAPAESQAEQAASPEGGWEHCEEVLPLSFHLEGAESDDEANSSNKSCGHEDEEDKLADWWLCQ